MVPKIVEDTFNCGSNELESLEGGPNIVGDYYCNNNKLISLNGISEVVNGLFNASNNKLNIKSLIEIKSDIKLQNLNFELNDINIEKIKNDKDLKIIIEKENLINTIDKEKLNLNKEY